MLIAAIMIKCRIMVQGRGISQTGRIDDNHEKVGLHRIGTGRRTVAGDARDPVIGRKLERNTSPSTDGTADQQGKQFWRYKKRKEKLTENQPRLHSAISSHVTAGKRNQGLG